jgi:hypothetical protein
MDNVQKHNICSIWEAEKVQSAAPVGQMWIFKKIGRLPRSRNLRGRGSTRPQEDTIDWKLPYSKKAKIWKVSWG